MARFIDIEPYEKMGYHNLVRFPNGNQFEAIYTPLDEIPTAQIIPLKEQEAVKPRSKSRHGAYPQFQHFCGNCNAMLHGKPKFCSNCGRKVKCNE